MTPPLPAEEFLRQLGVTENLRRIMARSAREFEESGDWVTFDILAYESATSEEPYDIDEVFRLSNVLGGAWSGEKVNLTGLGLVLAGTAPRATSQMVRLARICGERKLQLRDEAQISAAILVQDYSFDPLDARRAEQLVQMLPGLTSGGQLGENWSLSIFRTALDYRHVETVEDLRAILQGQAEDRLRFLQAATASRPLLGDVWRPGFGDGEPAQQEPEREQPEPADRNRVFVAYGRDGEATAALWSFLQDLGLKPLDWWEMVAETGQGSPFTGEIVDQALKMAQAIVILMTPDDLVRLHPDLVQVGEAPYELVTAFQPRPNVLFEAGLAFGRRPDRTILVELGTMRPVTDLGGRHTVRLRTEQTLRDLASRLEVAGCPVDRSNQAWLDASRFANLKAHSRAIDASVSYVCPAINPETPAEDATARTFGGQESIHKGGERGPKPGNGHGVHLERTKHRHGHRALGLRTTMNNPSDGRFIASSDNSNALEAARRIRS
ncbi:MAG TPA: nucleotide-binding protein [Chloroflexota bacterium]|nr:nucleotide-binding protein [Chloroflexota bacterium]